MIKIFYFLFLIHIISSSSVDECYNAGKSVSCTSIKMDINGYKCFENGNSAGKHCIPFPIDKNKQQLSLKISNIVRAEKKSIEMNQSDAAKDFFYDRTVSYVGTLDVTIEGVPQVDVINFSDNYDYEDSKIVERSDTCGNLAYDFYQKGIKGEIKLSKDQIKQKCYSASLYKIAENIATCGFVSLQLKINGKQTIIHSCMMVGTKPVLNDEILSDTYKRTLFTYYLSLLGIVKTKPDEFRNLQETSKIDNLGFSIETEDGNIYSYDDGGIKLEKEAKGSIYFKIKYCIYNDNSLTVNILEKQNKSFENYYMNVEEDQCSWTRKINFYDSSFKFKFILYKERSIMRWELGNYREIKSDEFAKIIDGTSTNGELAGCSYEKNENKIITLECSWNELSKK